MVRHSALLKVFRPLLSRSQGALTNEVGSALERYGVDGLSYSRLCQFRARIRPSASYSFPICRSRVRCFGSTSAFELEETSQKDGLNDGGERDKSYKSDEIDGVVDSSDESFKDLFPRLVQDVASSLNTPGAEDVVGRFQKVCEYNVPHGKLARGLLVVETFAAALDSPLSPDQQCRREEMMEKARILGWCVEWLQAALLVLDDVMDGSPMRRGRAAWHARPEVGIAAVNDGLFLENCVLLLLEKHFSHLPSYVPLLHLFRSIHMKTIFGQAVDMASTFSLPEEFPPRAPSSDAISPTRSHEVFSNVFTRQRYEVLCLDKTAHYSFTLPVMAGLRLAGISNSPLESRLSSILRTFGLLFQSQDDLIDCFGDAQVTGKVGTDIQEGKCTWLIVEALARADEETKAALARAYGRDDSSAVADVKDTYLRLGLPSVFEDYEEKLGQNLVQSIASLDSFQFPTQFLFDVLNKMQKRKK